MLSNLNGNSKSLSAIQKLEICIKYLKWVKTSNIHLMWTLISKMYVTITRLSLHIVTNTSAFNHIRLPHIISSLNCLEIAQKIKKLDDFEGNSSAYEPIFMAYILLEMLFVLMQLPQFRLSICMHVQAILSTPTYFVICIKFKERGNIFPWKIFCLTCNKT